MTQANNHVWMDDPTKAGVAECDPDILNECLMYLKHVLETQKANTDLLNITDSAKTLIAHNAMPSNTYIDLALGATGTEYTAPADGYFYIAKTTNVNSERFVMLRNISTGGAKGLSDYCGVAVNNSFVCASVQVKKGDKVLAVYNANGSAADNTFRFYYAVGAESEAE